MTFTFESYKISFKESTPLTGGIKDLNLNDILKQKVLGNASNAFVCTFQLGSDNDNNTVIEPGENSDKQKDPVDTLKYPVMGFCCKKTTSGSVTTYSEPYFCCLTFSDDDPVTIKELKAYKINTGKVNGASFNIIPEEKNATVDGTNKKVTVYKIGVISDGKVLFGLDFKNLSGDKPTYYFYLPKLSTFLEGPHVDFSDLPAGTYLTKEDQVVITSS